MSKQVKHISEMYLQGILEGRKTFNVQGLTYAGEHIENLNSTIKKFDASNPVGQLLRGERDFWVAQVKTQSK